MIRKQCIVEGELIKRFYLWPSGMMISSTFWGKISDRFGSNQAISIISSIITIMIIIIFTIIIIVIIVIIIIIREAILKKKRINYEFLP